MIIITEHGSFDSKLESITILFDSDEIYNYVEQMFNFGKINSFPNEQLILKSIKEKS